MKVLVADKFSQEGLKVFEEAADIELDYRPGLTAEELLKAVADAEALVVRGGSQVTAEVFDAAKRLRCVGRAGIGVENMDLAAANRRGVVVMNTPFGSSTTSAEHTISLLMSLARLVPMAHADVKAGRWEPDAFLGVEITGKTLGVLGAGKIGRLVVERALALKMKVLVYDPYLAEDVVRQMGAEQVEFEEVLSRSDFLTLHLPRNAETEGLIGEEALRLVKPTCRIVNCAQGGLIDEQALARAIREGRVAGAALDVLDKEPPGPEHPLVGLDQVVLTPHLRNSTLDAQTNVALQVAHQIVNYLQRGIVENALNVPAVSAELLNELRPFIELAEKLGSFQAQLSAKGLQSVTVEYAGTIAEHPTEPLTMALLKGLLTPVAGDIVNYVNAPHLARERGVRVIEAKSTAAQGFANMIRLSVQTAQGEQSVCGTLFGENDYRIVSVNDYPVEAVPQGHILVLNNADRPGVIGFLGQVLAEAQINIAMMNLSRRKIKGRAVSLITVDSEIPEEVLEKLRANEHILTAVQVNL